MITLTNLERLQTICSVSKCDFWLKKVNFLGHVVFGAGNVVYPAKIEAVLKCEPLKTAVEI